MGRSRADDLDLDACGSGRREIERYLRSMDRALLGPSKARADMVSELREGLEDAIEAHMDGGLGEDEAAKAALAEFGTVRQVASGLQRELSYAQGRRTAWLLSFLVIVQTLVAQFAWTNDPKAIGTDADLVTGYTTLANALDVFQYFTLVVGIAAIVAFGWGERWVAIRPMMVGVVGVFAFAALVIKSIIGFLLVALVPGMLAESMTDPLGLLQQLFLWILPTCYVAGSAWSSCRAAAVRGFRVRES